MDAIPAAWLRRIDVLQSDKDFAATRGRRLHHEIGNFVADRVDLHDDCRSSQHAAGVAEQAAAHGLGVIGCEALPQLTSESDGLAERSIELGVRLEARLANYEYNG